MQYLLTLGEFSILVTTDAALILIGWLSFRPWTRQAQAPPLFLTAPVCVGAFVLYLLITRFLWIGAESGSPRDRLLGEATETTVQVGLSGELTESSRAVSPLDDFNEQIDEPAPPNPPSRVLTVLLYCLAFWTFPVAYFSQKLLAALESYSVERHSWLELTIPDPEEFGEGDEFYEAQDLAMNGEIRAAVSQSNTYSRRRINGCFAAARILESDGRSAEAAELFEEIARQVKSDNRAWAEATFRLAKIRERALDDAKGAIALYNEICVRMPDSQYGNMASTNLQRLNPTGDALLDALDAGFEYDGVSEKLASETEDVRRTAQSEHSPAADG
ncbi:MAG: hypothetical protein AAB353_09970 [Candidatus Hydrogenedentota bacterium]